MRRRATGHAERVAIGDQTKKQAERTATEVSSEEGATTTDERMRGSISYIYTYIYIYIYTCIHIYIYIYIEREIYREREIYLVHSSGPTRLAPRLGARIDSTSQLLLFCCFLRTALDSFYHESVGTSGRSNWTA